MRMCTYWNKVGLAKSKTKKNKKIDSIGIGLASPEEIQRWGERRLPNGTLIGKVDKDHTVDYESLKPIEGGLFCERIFGPVEDFCCSCERRGKKNEKFCPNCEVEFTKSRVRRTRMGYIPLAVPVAHVWYLRGRPSYIANLIGKSRIAVDRLAYGETLCESFSGNTNNPFFRSTSCIPKGSTAFPLISSQHSAFEDPNPCKTNPFKFADLTKLGIQPPTSLRSSYHSFHYPQHTLRVSKPLRGYGAFEPFGVAGKGRYAANATVGLLPLPPAYPSGQQAPSWLWGLRTHNPFALQGVRGSREWKQRGTAEQMNFGTGWRTQNLGDASTSGIPADPLLPMTWVCFASIPSILYPFGVMEGMAGSTATFGMQPLPLGGKGCIPSDVNASDMVAVARPKVVKETQLSEIWNKGIQQKDLHELHATLTNFHFHKKLRQAISSIKTNCISISNRCPSGFSKHQKNGFNHSYAIFLGPSFPSPFASFGSPATPKGIRGRQVPLLPFLPIPHLLRKPFALQGACYQYPFGVRYAGNGSEAYPNHWKQWIRRNTGGRSIPKILDSPFQLGMFPKVIGRLRSLNSPLRITSKIKRIFSTSCIPTKAKGATLHYLVTKFKSVPIYESLFRIFFVPSAADTFLRFPSESGGFATLKIAQQTIYKQIPSSFRSPRSSVWPNFLLNALLLRYFARVLHTLRLLRNSKNKPKIYQRPAFQHTLRLHSFPPPEALHTAGSKPLAKQRGNGRNGSKSKPSATFGILPFPATSKGSQVLSIPSFASPEGVLVASPLQSKGVMGYWKEWKQRDLSPPDALRSSLASGGDKEVFVSLSSKDHRANDNTVEIQKKKQKGYHNQERNFEKNIPEKYNKYHTLPLFSTFVYKEWSHRFSFLEYFIWSAQKDDLTLPFYVHHHEITRNISYATRKNSLNLVKNKFLLHFAKNTSNIDFNIGNSSMLACGLNRKSFASHRKLEHTLQSYEADEKLYTLGMLRNHHTVRLHTLPPAYPSGQQAPSGLWGIGSKRKQYPFAFPAYPSGQQAPKRYWKQWACEDRRGSGFAKDMYKEKSKPFALADLTKSAMKDYIPDEIRYARASQQGLWDSLKKGDVSITSRASFHYPEGAFEPFGVAGLPEEGSEAATISFGSACPEGLLGSSEDLPTKLIDTQQFPRLAELLCFTGGTALRHLLSRFHLVLLGKFLRHELKNLELKVNNLLALKILTYSQGLLLGKLAKRRSKQIRRLKLLELFQSQKSNPEWMILSVLPVLPPDLRPILRVNDDFVVASDLNRLYQTVLRRNNTIHERMDDPLPCPESGLFRQRSLQKAVDGLLENGKGGGAPLCASKRRPLVSLSHVLKGKKGLFRQHLLGKRVDYSGRSVIVVGPRLNLHECGLPKEMAMELFQPFLLHRLKIKGFALSNTAARRMIQQEDPVIWHILKQLVYEHPVLLNRAPTLHRLGIQAFQPRLVSGRAILLHPLVCSGFNADFDGDQMAVHVPLSFQARAEAWKIMWSKNNFLSPATGQPILVPSQDMVLGCYYLSVSVPRVLGFLTASKTKIHSIDNPAAAYLTSSGQQEQDRRSVHSINIPLTKRRSVNKSILATTRASFHYPEGACEAGNGSEAATIPFGFASHSEGSANPEGVLGSHERNTKFIAPLAWPSSSPLPSAKQRGKESFPPPEALHSEGSKPPTKMNPKGILPAVWKQSRWGNESKEVFASHSAGTLYLHKNKGHYFSNLQDSLVAYFQGRLQTHTPFWVRVNQTLLRSTNENIKTSFLETSIPKCCIPSSSSYSLHSEGSKPHTKMNPKGILPAVWKQSRWGNGSKVASFEKCLQSCEATEPLGIGLKTKPPKVVKIVKSCSAFFRIVKRRRVFSTNDNVNKELTLLQPKYGSSQEVCKTLFQDSLHNIIIEGNDTLEAPLEVRLSADGNLVKILTTFQNHYNSNATIIDQCKEKSEKFLKYMRTTAGRVVLNKALFIL